MLNHFLEYLLVFVFIFYHCILWEIWKNIEKIPRASNSEVNIPIWLKFELVRDMPFQNFCKFHKDPNKKEYDNPEQ